MTDKKFRFMVAATSCYWCSYAAGQVSKERPEEERTLWGAMSELAADLKQLGEWSEQSELIDTTAKDLWEANNWNDESDLFARDTLTEVGKIPPWNIDGRISKLTERVAERYDFEQGVQMRLKQSIYGSMVGLMMENASLILDQTKEIVGTRVRGEPFTAEQVAEWTRQTEDMMGSFQERTDKLLEEFSHEVDDAHRPIFERDMESFQQRRTYMKEARQRWANGEWSPSEWGLQHDPLHNKAAQAGQKSANQPTSAPAQPPPRWVSYDPSTWEAYMLDFIARFKLDLRQQATARSILDELTARAYAYLHARRLRMANVAASERLAHPFYAPVRGMFKELETRLNRIPIKAQREKKRP